MQNPDKWLKKCVSIDMRIIATYQRSWVFLPAIYCSGMVSCPNDIPLPYPHNSSWQAITAGGSCPFCAISRLFCLAYCCISSLNMIFSPFIKSNCTTELMALQQDTLMPYRSAEITSTNPWRQPLVLTVADCSSRQALSKLTIETRTHIALRETYNL